jgi:predicted MFS family arabinose efflux permease
VSRLVERIAPSRLGVGFRWWLASSWVSNLGDGFALAAGPLLVASQSRDPRLVAASVLLQQLPWLVFGLFAGALADRLDRRLLVAVVDGLRAFVLVLLVASIATDTVNIAQVLVAMFLMGTAEVFSNTAASTLVPTLVPRADLGVANARMQAGWVTVNQLAGPPIGAALFALGLAVPFAAQAVLVGLGAVLVAKVARPASHEGPREATRLRADIAEGVRWVVHHPAVRTLVLTILIFNVTFGAAWSVLVLYARDRLGLGAVGFGLITVTMAVGGILASLSYGWISRRVRLSDLMRIGLVVETLTHLSLALTTSPAVAMVIFFAFGAHASIWGTTSATIRQRAVPLPLQGRVSSVNALGTFTGMVLGAALGGPIAAHWNITAPFWFAFVGSGLFVLAIWGQLRHIAHDDDLEEAAVRAEAADATVAATG